MEKTCTHYKRRCHLVTPCCDKVYCCRFCHNDSEQHELDRSKVEELVCSQCSHRQPLGTHCEECSILFGMYSCLECRLFDDTDKKQFHCDQCGFCRVGGRENFIHCNNCGICMDKAVIGTHNCRSESGKDVCPVCFESVHTSPGSVFVPKCGHLIHFDCVAMINKYQYLARCPLCRLVYNDGPVHGNNNTHVIDIVGDGNES